MGQGSLLVVAASSVLFAGCANTTGPGERSLFKGDPDPGRAFQTPDAVAGGTRNARTHDRPTPARAREDQDAADAKARSDLETAALAERAKADALWTKAEATANASDAADAYNTIAEDYKESPRAEEARWREGSKRFEAGEWNLAIAALDKYTRDHPVNPHLADAERMLYESALRVHEGARGFVGVFKSDKSAYEGLEAIVERLPQGAYADDALMALGDFYTRKEDWANAALQYKNLLLRYPDSEWSFKARLRLGDVYLARDQGTAYHAGYVDLDPREPASPQANQSRPVRSCVEAALVQYDAFLERIAADPARRREYADDVAYARTRSEECRRRLADKDRDIAAFYARRGQGTAAETYGRFAANVESGKPWSDGIPPPTTTTGRRDQEPPAASSPRPAATPTPQPDVMPASRPTAMPPVPPSPPSRARTVPSPSAVPTPPPPAPRPPPPTPPPAQPVSPPAVESNPPATPPVPAALPPPRRISR